RPFFDVTDGQCAELVGFPAGVFPEALGGAAGYVDASLTTRFQGFDITLLHNCYDNDPLQLDLLAGFRFLDLRERLTISESVVTGAGTTSLANSVIGSVDEFRTENDFYGGQ